MKIYELYEKEDQQADTALTHYILADFSKRLYKEIERQGLQDPKRKTAHRGPLRFNIEAMQDSLGLRKNAFYMSERVMNGERGRQEVDHVIPVAQLRNFYLNKESSLNDYQRLKRIIMGPTAKIMGDEHTSLNKKGSKDNNPNIMKPFIRYAEVGIPIFRTDTNERIDTATWSLKDHYKMAYSAHKSKLDKLDSMYKDRTSIDYKVMCDVLKKMLADLGCE